MIHEHVVVFGATGRVGAEVVDQALKAGHAVTAVARDPTKVVRRHGRLRVAPGDTLDPPTVVAALSDEVTPVTAVVMAVGDDPGKASTLVTNSVINIMAAMTESGVHRYLGISGTAQMPATAWGRVSQLVGLWSFKAAADHQGAFDVIAASSLDYVIAACPHIKEGPTTGHYTQQPGRFPGGYKTIAPGEVADFLVRQLQTPSYHRQIIGIWH
jgi:putative NADH-flavin reductase